MPEYQEGTLRVHGIGDVPVEDIQVFLSNISHCYNSICVFESSIIQIAEDARFTKEFIPDRLFRYRWMEPFFASRGYTRSLLTDYSIPLRDIVPPGRHLVLQAVSLQSPGFWDFLGKLNPLEVIRLYLNDRHERRKDHEYRESAEREKLNLENELLKNQVFEGRLNLLRDLGVTDEELAPLKNRFIHAPLDSLGLAQDRKLINAAEIVHKPQRLKK